MSTETQAPAETVTPETPAVEVAKTDEPLGAPGLAALKSEREAKAAAEKRAAAAEARIKAFEDAQKTEAEKQAERLAEFERENAELKSAKTRAEVAAAKGVPANLLSGTSQAEFEAAADALIKFKADATQTGYVAPNEGRGAGANGDSTADSFARFFEKQIN